MPRTASPSRVAIFIAILGLLSVGAGAYGLLHGPEGLVLTLLTWTAAVAWIGILLTTGPLRLRDIDVTACVQLALALLLPPGVFLAGPANHRAIEGLGASAEPISRVCAAGALAAAAAAVTTLAQLGGGWVSWPAATIAGVIATLGPVGRRLN